MTQMQFSPRKKAERKKKLHLKSWSNPGRTFKKIIHMRHKQNHLLGSNSTNKTCKIRIRCNFTWGGGREHSQMLCI